MIHPVVIISWVVVFAFAAIMAGIFVSGQTISYWNGYNDGMNCAAQIYHDEPTTRCTADKGTK